jgi:4-aminobutyrate aminotransferase
LAIAAAHAVIEVMREEKLPTRGQRLGDELKAVLASLRDEIPQIADIRGLGAMVAVEFNQPGTDTPDAVFTKRVLAEAMQRDLILLSCGVHANVVRFLFPLTIQDDVFAEAMEILRAAMLAATA